MSIISSFIIREVRLALLAPVENPLEISLSGHRQALCPVGILALGREENQNKKILVANLFL